MGTIPPLPAELLAQARLAARHQVGLDAVLRGYVVGSTLMDDFILEECDGASAQALMRSRALALDRLLSRISTEYESERRTREGSRETRALEGVRSLLRGEPSTGTGFDYDLGDNHIGLVARGSDSKGMIRAVARSLDSRLLLVAVDSDNVWAWLGRRGALHAEEVQVTIASERQQGVSIGLGESANGITGWRHTHRQARASLPVALRSATGLARYADVCLIASAIQDDLLRSSLHALYLQPLLAAPNGQRAYVETLRAYFAADRNGASAASSLGVSRQTVVNRLRAVEERLGCSLSSCASAVELALDMIDLDP